MLNHDRLGEVLGARVTRRSVVGGVGAAAAGLVAARGARLVGAQEASPMASPGAATIPEVAFVAKDYQFAGLPATIPAGWTKITMTNAGPSDHHAMFVMLNPGKTVDDFKAAAAIKGPAAVGALLAIAKSVGGPNGASAGEKSSVIVNLQPGQYVVICAIPDDQGIPHYQHGMLVPVEVTGTAPSGVAEPTADQTIELTEFKFNMLPSQVTAGQHTWKVTDTGQQLHEFVVYRLMPGVTFDQIQAMLAAEVASPAATASPMAGMEMGTPMAGMAATPAAPPPQPASPAAQAAPFVGAGGAAPMNPGETNYVLLDLVPGNYFAVCFVPDPKTGAPHAALGMIMPFTVS